MDAGKPEGKSLLGNLA